MDEKNITRLNEYLNETLAPDAKYNNSDFCTKYFAHFTCYANSGFKHYTKCWSAEKRRNECQFNHKKVEVIKKWEICLSDAADFFKVIGTQCSAGVECKINITLF